MKIRKRVLIPLVGLAVASGVIGYTVPSYRDCKNSDLSSHKQTAPIDVVVIWGGDNIENVLNGYELANRNSSFVIINGNDKELAVVRRSREEYGFHPERVIEDYAGTTAGGVIDVYKIAKSRL